MDIYSYIENISQNIISSLVSIERPIDDFFNVLFNSFSDWIFILIATIIGSVVAVTVDRKFKDHKSIQTKYLLKEVFKQTIAVTITVAITLIFAGIFLGLFAGLLNVGAKYSALVTLLVVIAIGFCIYLKRKKRKRALLARLRKIKNRKV